MQYTIIPATVVISAIEIPAEKTDGLPSPSLLIESKSVIHL